MSGPTCRPVWLAVGHRLARMAKTPARVAGRAELPARLLHANETEEFNDAPREAVDCRAGVGGQYFGSTYLGGRRRERTGNALHRPSAGPRCSHRRRHDPSPVSYTHLRAHET